jgi:hypothetical protein
MRRIAYQKLVDFARAFLVAKGASSADALTVAEWPRR